MNYLVWVLVLLGVMGMSYCYLRKRTNYSKPIQIETYDSITLTDIVSLLKLEHPDQQRHTPFIGTIEILKNFKNIRLQFQPAPDQIPIVIGIYDRQIDTITYVKVLYVKELDDAAKSVFEKAKESIVVLE